MKQAGRQKHNLDLWCSIGSCLPTGPLEGDTKHFLWQEQMLCLVIQEANSALIG